MIQNNKKDILFYIFLDLIKWFERNFSKIFPVIFHWARADSGASQNQYQLVCWRWAALSCYVSVGDWGPTLHHSSSLWDPLHPLLSSAGSRFNGPQSQEQKNKTECHETVFMRYFLTGFALTGLTCPRWWGLWWCWWWWWCCVVLWSKSNQCVMSGVLGSK